MSAQVTSAQSNGTSRREAFAGIGMGVAIVAMLIALALANHARTPSSSATTAGTEQTSAQGRSPAVDAALLEAALDLGPVVSTVCTGQLGGTPACYALHGEGIWTRLARQDDGTWLTVDLVIPRTEGT